MTKRNGNWIILKIDCHYPLNDLLTLVHHEIQRQKQRLPKVRKRVQTDQIRLKAKRLRAEGWSYVKIVKSLLSEGVRKIVRKTHYR